VIGDILQPTHLLFVLVIALLVLGPKRLPEAGRALGRGLRDFKNALNTDDIREQMLSTTSTQTSTPMSEQPTEVAPVSSEIPNATVASEIPNAPVSSEIPNAPTGSADQPSETPEQTAVAADAASPELSTPPREAAAAASAQDLIQ
jgi:sec-independent protein translocase protein TatA